MLRGSHPTPTWCTAKAPCQRHANIAILSAICISLHAFWRGAWGLPLEDKWKCPSPPKRVSHLAEKKGCRAKQGNGPEDEPVWVVPQTIQGKVSRFLVLVNDINHTYAIGILNSVQVHFCFLGYKHCKYCFTGYNPSYSKFTLCSP